MSIEKTIELLELIYNSSEKSTPIRKIQSSNLRKRLIEEIKKFVETLEEYDDETLELAYRQRAEAKIRGHLSNKSPFTAFKRWIVRENEHFNSIFGLYCQ